VSNFKAGDVVQLKSGGPLMTIKEVGEFAGYNQGVRCVWFAGSKMQTGIFDSASLKAADGGYPKTKTV
jgi:uncharacterized protein YodC (DUF2158 family)